ncbi:Pappalysin-1 [Labeo rohita]|uniref:Pappalysin-1 n=1 Tax=Labeo rohita TaxID=84645 RepID=A0ABQ8M8X9_LABRO|nr:Pappalysin-1 [Labeo rohita]
MDPTVLLILLKQGERSLEDHTRDYIFLAEHSHFPDSSLCTFYRAGLNTTAKGLLSGGGSSREPAGLHREDVSPTPDPEPSQPSPRHAEHEPEPTADDEPEPRATEQRITQEPEPNTSDQVREPATTTATVECCVEQERAMESPAHCTTAGGELELNSGDLMDFFTEVLETHSGDLIDFSTEIPTCHDLPPTTCAVGSPAGLPASIGVMAGGSLSSASSLRVQNSASALRPCGSTTALSSLISTFARRPTSSTGLPRPSGSALVGRRPAIASGLHSSGFASSLRPAGSVGLLPLAPAPPQSSVAPAPLRTSGSPLPPRSPEPWAPPWPSGSSVSPWIFGSLSPPRAPPPPAPPPSVGPLELSALPPPWLLPPSAPPWAYIMAAVWVSTGFSCFGSLLFLPWLLPPSSPPWTLRTLFFVFRPPPKPPPTWTLFCCSFFAPLVCFVLFPTARGRAYSEGGHTLYKSVSVLSVLSVFVVDGGYYVCGYSSVMDGLMALTEQCQDREEKEQAEKHVAVGISAAILSPVSDNDMPPLSMRLHCSWSFFLLMKMFVF